ncbi:C-type lectin domain family 4 member E-like isoform X4 [Conger conger]|uniref:C-type lectin domain family 4 member E-like isoform X3 n=1 Tax=Conger conger TaxID=82655 RepID=UPI002A59AD41|nr:C-type lectin domain family 4 member E-like isoform X3 [Conger conger]XP_061088109.1 C-type lectin domain family 4 member E-like isoform X4 [Conger conger]
MEGNIYANNSAEEYHFETLPSNQEKWCDQEQQAGRQTPQRGGQRRPHCHLYCLVTICVVLQIAGLCAWICMYSQINAGIQDLDAEVSALNVKDSQINAGIQDLDAKVSALNVKAPIVFVEISGWKRFGCKAYYLSNNTSTWEMAREQCIAMGATLAMVKTEEEMEFLANAIAQRFWVGLNDIGTEGTWKWLDGTSPASGMWTPGEPNNEGEEDCAEVIKKLNDVPCGEKRHWICEKSLVI